MKHLSFFRPGLPAPTVKGRSSSTRRPRSTRYSVLVGLLAVFVILPALIISTSSATSNLKSTFMTKPVTGEVKAERRKSVISRAASKGSAPVALNRLFPITRQPVAPLTPQAPVPETLETFAADCSTTKTNFVLGETVCARVSGAPGFSIQAFYWSNASNFLVQNSPILTASQDDTFVLPSTPTSPVGVFTANNRGTWKITAAGIDDAVARAIAFITVRSAAAPAADLSVFKFPANNEGRVNEGTNVSFALSVANIGPDAAPNVTLTDVTPTNMTLVSLVEDAGGAGFSCAGSVCTIASLPKDGRSSFTATYSVANVASETVSAFSASVSDGSPTVSDPDSSNDTVSGEVVITGTNNTPAACTLGCSNDLVVNAPTGQAGANVTFAAPTTSGSVCNPVTCSATSGGFFSLGTTVVTCQAATDDSCTFTVTVNDTQAPDIGACPANISVNESSSGSGSAVVNYATPSATDNSGIATVTCDKPSGSSFTVAGSPHTVVCTATDDAGLTDTCSFQVSVTGVAGNCGLTTIGNVTVNSNANQCGANVTYAAPVSDGSGTCGTITCDHPSGSFFPVGTTTVMCTDTSVGTSSFTVTVEDHTAPVPTVANLPDINAQCFIQVNRPTATDACLAGTISATTGDPLQYDTPGTYVIHWTYTDSAGNTSTQNQNVVIAADTTAPVIVTCATNKTITANSSCATMPNLTTEVEATDNCTETTITQSVAPGTTLPSGVTTVVITATDNAGNTATCTRTITVVDAIKPVISLTGASSVTVECHTSFTDPGATATDNCDTAVSVTPSSNVNLDVPGTYTINYNATDSAGNAANVVSRTVNVVDTTAPVISCPANVVVYLPANSSATSMVVNYSAPTATESCSTATVNSSPASGSVFPVGTTTVNATATDAAGNSSNCSFTVTVLYNFTGFFSPVANIPTLNTVNAGKAVPVKFSLSGDKGLNIFAAGNPYSTSLNCSTSDPGVDVTETLTAGGSSLSYSSDQYVYVWKTESSWAGTCRQLVLTLNDSSVHTAYFKFK